MENLIVTWNGASGRPYDFSIFPIGTECIPYPGVYIFTRETSPGWWQALYVGESNSFHDRLYARLEDHDGYKRAARAGATHIGLHFTRASERLWIETDLRHGLNPVCNKQSLATVIGGNR